MPQKRVHTFIISFRVQSETHFLPKSIFEEALTFCRWQNYALRMHASFNFRLMSSSIFPILDQFDTSGNYFCFQSRQFSLFLSWQFQFSTANNRIRYYPSVPWNYDCVRLLRTWDPPSKAKKWVEGTKNNALTENNKANTTLGIQSLIWSLLREFKDRGGGGAKLHSRCYWFAFISYNQHYAW